jgi:hypothetical protein
MRLSVLLFAMVCACVAIGIAAPAEKIYRALTTEEGIKTWWTTDVKMDAHAGGKVVFGFFDHSTVFEMRIEQLILNGSPSDTDSPSSVLRTPSPPVAEKDGLKGGAAADLPASIRDSSLFQEHESLRAACLAGALVLLVAFWFDGGLFKLPTAALFWVLLELGAARTQRIEG